ncbi:MAG: ABC transporter permease [Acidimicrobiales bacterium]|nr:ABC transporter permease [Acidimicrobiales bacterium]MCB9394173.1 ABC transporter permease [Acidimicrobiaceae bacterium]
MTSVLVSRLARLLAVLLAVTAASFGMVGLLPGDTVTAMLGANASAEDRQAVREDLRLDDPLPVRYARWVGDAVTGDLGTSYRTRQPVTEAIGQRLGVTLELVLLSQLIALAIAVPMAIFGALRPGSWLDKLLSGTQLAMLATPGYLVAVALMAVFAVQLGWFDTTGYVRLTDDPFGNVKSLLLPSIALATEQVALYARVMRTDLVNTFDQDFIWFARAKGNSTRRIVVHHALRPSSIGIVTLTGISVGRMIGGTVLVETIFSLPGLGRFTIDAINNRDFVALQGAVVVLTVGFVVVNFAADLLHGVLDPRIRAAVRPT